MCDPMTLAITSFMVQAGSAGLSYAQKSQDAKLQDQYYDANRVSAIDAAGREDQQIALRKQQEEDAAGTKKFDNALETKAKAARAAAGAGEAGITGLSVESLVQDILGAGGRANDRITANNEMTQTQLTQERSGVSARMNDRINSVRKGVQPNPLALGLQIVGAGVDSGTKYKAMTR